MEITDDKIFKIALITSLIGILGLIIFTPYIEVKEIKIIQINRGMVDEEVAITGVIEDIKKSSNGNTYFLKINDGTGHLSLIIFESVLGEFEDSNTPIESFKKKKVKAVGTLTEYKSNMELIISNGNSLQVIS